jgi:hypothetical protein
MSAKITVQCSRHPRYTGKKLAGFCPACVDIYNAVHQDTPFPLIIYWDGELLNDESLELEVTK